MYYIINGLTMQIAATASTERLMQEKLTALSTGLSLWHVAEARNKKELETILDTMYIDLGAIASALSSRRE